MFSFLESPRDGASSESDSAFARSHRRDRRRRSHARSGSFGELAFSSRMPGSDGESDGQMPLSPRIAMRSTRFLACFACVGTTVTLFFLLLVVYLYFVDPAADAEDARPRDSGWTLVHPNREAQLTWQKSLTVDIRLDGEVPSWDDWIRTFRQAGSFSDCQEDRRGVSQTCRKAFTFEGSLRREQRVREKFLSVFNRLRDSEEPFIELETATSKRTEGVEGEGDAECQLMDASFGFWKEILRTRGYSEVRRTRTGPHWCIGNPIAAPDRQQRPGKSDKGDGRTKHVNDSNSEHLSSEGIAKQRILHASLSPALMGSVESPHELYYTLASFCEPPVISSEGYSVFGRASVSSEFVRSKGQRSWKEYNCKAFGRSIRRSAVVPLFARVEAEKPTDTAAEGNTTKEGTEEINNKQHNDPALPVPKRPRQLEEGNPHSAEFSIDGDARPRAVRSGWPKETRRLSGQEVARSVVISPTEETAIVYSLLGGSVGNPLAFENISSNSNSESVGGDYGSSEGRNWGRVAMSIASPTEETPLEVIYCDGTSTEENLSGASVSQQTEGGEDLLLCKRPKFIRMLTTASAVKGALSFAAKKTRGRAIMVREGPRLSTKKGDGTTEEREQQGRSEQKGPKEVEEGQARSRVNSQQGKVGEREGGLYSESLRRAHDSLNKLGKSRYLFSSAGDRFYMLASVAAVSVDPLLLFFNEGPVLSCPSGWSARQCFDVLASPVRFQHNSESGDRKKGEMPSAEDGHHKTSCDTDNIDNFFERELALSLLSYPSLGPFLEGSRRPYLISALELEEFCDREEQQSKHSESKEKTDKRKATESQEAINLRQQKERKSDRQRWGSFKRSTALSSIRDAVEDVMRSVLLRSEARNSVNRFQTFCFLFSIMHSGEVALESVFSQDCLSLPMLLLDVKTAEAGRRRTEPQQVDASDSSLPFPFEETASKKAEQRQLPKNDAIPLLLPPQLPPSLVSHGAYFLLASTWTTYSKLVLPAIEEAYYSNAYGLPLQFPGATFAEVTAARQDLIGVEILLESEWR